MSFSIQTYITKYLNKPNPTSGRGFWFDEEVAKAEGVPVALVAEMRGFCQKKIADGITDPAAIAKAWDELQADKPKPAPKIQINQITDHTLTGNIPWGVFKAELRAELRKILDI